MTYPMKMTSSLFAAVLASALLCAGAGCKKATPPPAAARDGVVIDSMKLRNSLNGASQEIQKSLAKFQFSLRYGSYVDAMMALDQMKADTSLTEAQKKIVDEVMEQVKTANNNKNAGGAAPEPGK